MDTLFTRATPGTPASLYYKAGDCLSIYLSFFLSVRLWTAKPQGLTWAEIWRIDVKSPDDECGLGVVGLKCHLR